MEETCYPWGCACHGGKYHHCLINLLFEVQALTLSRFAGRVGSLEGAIWDGQMLWKGVCRWSLGIGCQGTNICKFIFYIVMVK